MNIFREILDTASFTIIMYRIDDVLPTASPEDQAALQRMQDTNKLDEIYAIAHEHLGEPEEAAKLRAFMAQQAKRPKPQPIFAD